jgi:hypothetical protein
MLTRPEGKGLDLVLGLSWSTFKSIILFNNIPIVLAETDAIRTKKKFNK